jgi:hypothetical protein
MHLEADRTSFIGRRTVRDGWIRPEGMKYECVRENGIGPKQTAGGTAEGTAEGMEGMAVGGKSCCPITVRGERHGSLAGRSGVTNLSRQLLLSQYYLFTRYYSSHPSFSPPETPRHVEQSSFSSMKFSTEDAACFQHRIPFHVVRPWPAE